MKHFSSPKRPSTVSLAVFIAVLLIGQSAVVGAQGGFNNSLDAADGDPQRAVFVDADGNVGIGTDSPNEKLSVVSSTGLDLLSVSENGLTTIGPPERLGIPLERLTVTGTARFIGGIVVEGRDPFNVVSVRPVSWIKLNAPSLRSTSQIEMIQFVDGFEIRRNGKTRVSITDEEVQILNNKNFLLYQQYDTAPRMYLNDNGQPRISLSARRSRDGKGGLIEMKNDNERSTVEIIGDIGNGEGGLVEVKNGEGWPMVEIGGTGDGSGSIVGFDGSGIKALSKRNFELRSTFGNDPAAWMTLNDNGSQRITFAARNAEKGKGGLIDIRNGQGVVTVKIIGDTGNGSGRVRTSVLEITGGSDIAEFFAVMNTDTIEPGMVVAIDPDNPGKLRIAHEAYDLTVAGVISGAGDLDTGLIMQKQDTIAAGEFPIALTGRVYVWADVSNGAIQPGNMLTTSNLPGHAMKVTDYELAHGAVLGKAMTSLESGTGLVLVLISLQ